MRNWFEWIIPVIVVTVWILNAILKNREREEPVRRPRGKSPDGGERRTATSDIDRFLQEIERLRKQPGEGKPEPPKVVRAPGARVRPAGQQPPRVRAAPARVTARPVEVVAVEPRAETIPLPRPAAVAAPPPLYGSLPRQASAPLSHAMALLASPRSAASAIVLHEVFGPPKCRNSQR